MLFRRKSTGHRCDGPQIYSMSTDIECLVIYTIVKKINRGYITRCTIKTYIKGLGLQ